MKNTAYAMQASKIKRFRREVVSEIGNKQISLEIVKHQSRVFATIPLIYIPFQTKHERLLDEEFDVVRKGHDIARELTEWYSKRLTSLEKRKEMLSKGMVALVSLFVAFLESKYNSQLSRNYCAFLETR